ncbi:alba protein [Gregarina niphandrodes]|uniref:Alba protein n=1 Tax=Gregarina niphandrodes TaxID=110365 RepID=A0A023BDS3_GRENI|nr:alba protein [Gregarina niphandrodes]EZG89041.1 alba protein [Gregarina niphandrodes]|eukprot:XP_011128510.1 alba protein [Gregarina niphandrodes]
MPTAPATTTVSRREIDTKQYRPVKREREQPREGEVHVSNAGDVGLYALQAVESFNKDLRDEVVIRGSGFAVAVAITVAELIRHTVPGIHKVMTTGVAELTDTYVPNNESDPQLAVNRRVPYIVITLSKKKQEELPPFSGYAAPPSEEDMKASVQLANVQRLGGSRNPRRASGRRPQGSRGGNRNDGNRNDGNRNDAPRNDRQTTYTDNYAGDGSSQ